VVAADVAGRYSPAIQSSDCRNTRRCLLRGRPVLVSLPTLMYPCDFVPEPFT